MFCDNPKCYFNTYPSDARVFLTDINHTGDLEELSNYQFSFKNGKEFTFCAVCTESINMVFEEENLMLEQNRKHLIKE